MNKQERMQIFRQIDLYPVTCQRLSNGRNNMEVLEEVLAAGVKVVQLREKDFEKRELYELALKFKQRTMDYQALLIINDHLDIALAVEADGVHLGQKDLPVPAAYKIAPDIIIGSSSHTLEQALKAQGQGADYINIGPVYPTLTKDDVEKTLGPASITKIGRELRVPFTVMGGINSNNIDEVLKAGADKIAMISEITKSDDIFANVKELRRVINTYKQK